MTEKTHGTDEPTRRKFLALGAAAATAGSAGCLDRGDPITASVDTPDGVGHVVESVDFSGAIIQSVVVKIDLRVPEDGEYWIRASALNGDGVTVGSTDETEDLYQDEWVRVELDVYLQDGHGIFNHDISRVLVRVESSPPVMVEDDDEEFP